MLLIGKKFLTDMVSHCLDGYPLEACGLLGGVRDDPDTAQVRDVFHSPNLARSARIYEIDPQTMLRADRASEAAGTELIGVYHSHTHTEAKPSPTDIRQAPDPDWHYVLVSLRDTHPSVRSWRIRDGKIEEEPVVLE